MVVRKTLRGDLAHTHPRGTVPASMDRSLLLWLNQVEAEISPTGGSTYFHWLFEKKKMRGTQAEYLNAMRRIPTRT